MPILEILAGKNVIDQDDIVSIKEEARLSGRGIEEILLKRGVNPEDIEDAAEGGHGIKKRALPKEQPVSKEVLSYVPEESATYYKFVPIGVKDGVLEVGITDPDNLSARDALNFISGKIGMPYKLFLVSQPDFERVLGMYKGLSGEVTEALGEFEIEMQNKPGMMVEEGITDLESGSGDTPVRESDEKITEDAPVTKIVATILRYATEGEASDVHIEPMKEGVRVRFRVDGILHTSLNLPKAIHPALVARIKILSNMRLDEKRKPQDGRFSANIETRHIDFRVSTFPTYFGEKVVMRILDQEKGVKKLDELGFSARNLEYIKKALVAPYGIILISGPTGSGKTTTLYSMLNAIDRNEKNVLSLEDPVEYNIDGLSQSQVRPEIGYTFANGLRTTLRQDPDVIMVGEIRDKETAQLAIQAALTGHLVLSTIHTNNAFGVIPRLIDMGVDPYLISPTLILAIAQRLVSALSPGSGKPIPITGSMKIMVDKQFSDLSPEFRKDLGLGDNFYEPTPTRSNPEGIKGRLAVTEVLPMDKDLESIILKDPTELSITKLARSKGMLNMREDALIKASQKQIPFSEVNTV